MARSESRFAPRLALACLALLGGCDERRGEAQACRLTPAELVTRADASSFDDIAVAAAEHGALVAWSEPSGLYVRALSHEATPIAAPVRLGARCTGGIDVELGAREVIACSRTGGGDAPGEVVLITLDAGRHVASSVRLGDAGRDGRGVDVALEGTTTWVLFHDGTRERHRIELAKVEERAAPVVRTVSRAGQAASEPTLLVAGGHRFATWSETELGAEGSTTRVLVARDDEAPRVVTEVHVPEPAPSLAIDARGLVIGFRDRGDPRARAELRVARLDPSLALASKPRIAGRANGAGAPSLHACGDLRAALMPRDQAGERFIGVHALDVDLRERGASHQYYANSRDFVLARGACSAGGLLALAAERTTPADRGVELVAMRFGCRD